MHMKIATVDSTLDPAINDTFRIFNQSTLEDSSSELNKTLADWGPRRDSLYIVIPVSLIYIATFITGILGNVSTCIVIARNRSMHTATNYYLFSLAISDLLLLISGLPPEIYAIWFKYPYIFGEAFCILQGFFAETSANATVLTITAFTVERYVAICHPFLSHTLSKLNRAIKFIIAIWIKAMCLAIPQAMAFGIVCEESPEGVINPNLCVCSIKRIVIPHAFIISTMVFFIAPMTLISVLYILIGLQLHRSTVGPSRGNSVKLKHRLHKPVAVATQTSFPTAAQAVLVLNGESDHLANNQQEDGRKNFAKNAQATKHVVKMLIAVVVAFFICWAPFHAQRLLAFYGEHTSDRMIQAFQILTYISGILYYLSTTVNPLLYHIMSNKFREAFKNTYKHCFRRKHGVPGGRCYSTLSGRSSQVNSLSYTDSCSRQCSLRYLDAEMARLYDSERPLVVSFRRKNPQTSPAHRTKHVVICDISRHHPTVHKPPQYHHHPPPETINEDISFREVQTLQPQHICPLNISDLARMRYSRSAEINAERRVKPRSGST